MLGPFIHVYVYCARSLIFNLKYYESLQNNIVGFSVKTVNQIKIQLVEVNPQGF